MTLELELQLVNKFPELCKQYGGDMKETCFAFGFECYDGWFNLIEETLSEIDKISKENSIDVSIAQIKQKFGKLVIYLDFEPSEKPNKDGIQEIYKVIDSAYTKSEKISEISGLPGKIRNVNNWMIALTEEEYQETQKGGRKALEKFNF